MSWWRRRRPHWPSSGASRPRPDRRPWRAAPCPRRAGHTLGVFTVQNRAARHYTDDEVEVVETVAMVAAELLSATGLADASEEGLGAALPRRFEAVSLAPGIAIGPIVVHGSGHAPG